MKHFLITRYNVGLYDRALAHAEWMRRRAEFFTRFTLSSVLKQTEKNFEWIILYDPRTPPKDMLLEAPFKPDWVNKDERPNDAALRIIKTNYRIDDSELIITTRLDNDDAIAPNFIENVQRIAEGRDSKVITPPDGYSFHALLLETKRRTLSVPSPFCSLVERPFRTVLYRDHTLLYRDYEVHIQAGPQWLQVIHSTNQTNQFRGEPCAPVEVEEALSVSLT